MFDGVYVAHPDSGQPTFVAVPPTSDAQVQRLVEQAAVRLIQLMQRRGVLDGTNADALAEQQPVLSGLTAASVQGRRALSPHAGQRLRRVLADPASSQRTAPLCLVACWPLAASPCPRPAMPPSPTPLSSPQAALPA